MRTLTASVAIALAGTGVLSWRTHAFRAFTFDSVTRARLLSRPHTLPEVVFEDHLGRRFRTANLRGRPSVVTFMYTRCRTVCNYIGWEMAKLNQNLTQGTERVRLLSISLDPNEDRAGLSGYTDHFAKGRDRWLVVRVPDRGQLRELLRILGVIVIVERDGELTHNAILYITDANLRITELRDWTDLGADSRWPFVEGPSRSPEERRP